MSRGPGKWQRLILQTLQAQAAVDMGELLPPRHTRSAYMALLRAVLRLEAQGRIHVNRYLVALRSEGRSHLMLKRPGVVVDRVQYDRDRHARLAQK